MTKSFKLIVVAILSLFVLNVTALAQDNSGFTVNTVEGSADSGNIENFDPALITNCAALQYGPNDGALCSEAYDENADTEYTNGCQADYSDKCYQVTKSNFLSVKTITDDCDIAYNTYSFSSPYTSSYQNCKTAISLGYIVSSTSDLNTLNEANTGPYDAACNDQHGSDCNAINKVDFISSKTLFMSCSNYPNYSQCSDASDLNYGVNDSALYAEALAGTHDAACNANYSQACSGLDKADYQIARNIGTASADAASDIQQQIADGGVIDGSDITIALASTTSTVDGDVNLENALHVEFLQNCFGSNPNLAKIESCSANVDGVDLNQFAVAEIADGASGTIDQNLLEAAGISDGVAAIAVSNTCGPNQNQSCFDTVLATGLTADGITTAEFTTALLDYFEDAVEDETTTVQTATAATGCSNGQTVFAVPNPPTLCSSFANWNCEGITPGISVVWNDSGKGNINADSSVFSGGSYQVRAVLSVGSQSRTKTLSGTFNINAAVAGAQNGYKTASDPGYWGNPFNPLKRARDRCASWGGTLATHAEIREANSMYGTIIGNGTRVIFKAANGDDVAYTGSGTTTKPQCSNDFYQTGNNNIKGFRYRHNHYASCDGRSRSENFTSLCKDIPSC